MTPTEIRAINTLIATELFGFTDFSEVNGILLAKSPDSRIRNIPPNYVEEEEASAALRDKLKELGMRFSMSVSPHHENQWLVIDLMDISGLHPAQQPRLQNRPRPLRGGVD